MSEERPDSEAKSNNVTPITRTWRSGGPFTPSQRKDAMALFIEWLKKDPTVTLASEHAGIAPVTAYRWRDRYKSFADDWENAVKRTQDIARQSIYTRGILGWDEKVVSQGQMVMEYEPVVDEDGNQRFDEKGKPLFKGGKPLLQRKYSDSLASLYAKANLPEYKDKPQININAQLNDLAEQRKQKIIAELEAAIAKDEAIANEDEKSPHKEEGLQS